MGHFFHIQAKHWRWKVNWKSSSILPSTSFIPGSSLNYIRIEFLNTISVALEGSNTVFHPPSVHQVASNMVLVSKRSEQSGRMWTCSWWSSLTCRKYCRCLWSESIAEQAAEMHPDSKWVKVHLVMKEEQKLDVWKGILYLCWWRKCSECQVLSHFRVGFASQRI